MLENNFARPSNIIRPSGTRYRFSGTRYRAFLVPGTAFLVPGTALFWYPVPLFWLLSEPEEIAQLSEEAISRPLEIAEAKLLCLGHGRAVAEVGESSGDGSIAE